MSVALGAVGLTGGSIVRSALAAASGGCGGVTGTGGVVGVAIVVCGAWVVGGVRGIGGGWAEL